jgi:hypothetical protein
MSFIVTLKKHSSMLNRLISVVLTNCEPTTHVEVVIKFMLVQAPPTSDFASGYDRHCGGKRPRTLRDE